MNPWMVRHLTWPLHQLKTNRRVWSWYRNLLESQWWSPGELQLWQEEHLRRLLLHAAQHVPYYREQFRIRGLELEAPLRISHWYRIPVLSKAVVRERFEQLQATDRPRPFSMAQTSGSTGLPVLWRIDRQAGEAHKAAKLRTRHWWGFQIGDRHVWLWGRDEFLGRRKALRDLVVYNKRVLGLLELSDQTIESYYRDLLSWRPRYLYAYPSGVVQLAKLCHRHGYNLKALHLGGVISTAEVLTQVHRRYIQETFGCPAINEYGCSESQVIAFECPQGNMHLNVDTLLVEFLRDGQPVGPSELGEIVVTDLFNETMPLIRYQTGDLGRLKSGLCPCGRTLPLMELSVGRELEMVRLSDGRLVHPEVFTPPHDNPLFALVDQFRVIQESSTHFRVQVVTAQEQLETVRQHFVHLIVSQLGNGFDIEVEQVAEIPRDPSGKLRYFVSAIKPQSMLAEAP